MSLSDMVEEVTAGGAGSSEKCLYAGGVQGRHLNNPVSRD